MLVVLLLTNDAVEVMVLLTPTKQNNKIYKPPIKIDNNDLPKHAGRI
jgi:hypothetical protein